jgi:hypothetical protein
MTIKEATNGGPQTQRVAQSIRIDAAFRVRPRSALSPQLPQACSRHK